VITIVGDEGVCTCVCIGAGIGGTGGTGGAVLFGDKRAFVLGAETTLRNHRVAAEPFNGVFSLLSLSSGETGGPRYFLLGVLGDGSPRSGEAWSAGERESEGPIFRDGPASVSVDMPIPIPLYRSDFEGVATAPPPLATSRVGLLSRVGFSFSFSFSFGLEKNLALNPPNADPGDLDIPCPPCELVVVYTETVDPAR